MTDRQADERPGTAPGTHGSTDGPHGWHLPAGPAAWPRDAAGPLLLRHLARLRRAQHGETSATARRLDALADWLDRGCPGAVLAGSPAGQYPETRENTAPSSQHGDSEATAADLDEARTAGPASERPAPARPGSLPARAPAAPQSDDRTDFSSLGDFCGRVTGWAWVRVKMSPSGSDAIGDRSSDGHV